MIQYLNDIKRGLTIQKEDEAVIKVCIYQAVEIRPKSFAYKAASGSNNFRIICKKKNVYMFDVLANCHYEIDVLRNVDFFKSYPNEIDIFRIAKAAVAGGL